MRKPSQPIVAYTVAVFLMFLFLVGAGLAQQGSYLCGPGSTFEPTEYGNWLVECTEPVTATPTPLPTDTPAPTPTLEPTPTPEPPVVHDTNACHSAADGHTHGVCADELPAGAVRDFLAANPEYAELDHDWPSSATENLYPWPTGKHEGFKNLYFAFPGCIQLTNILPTPQAMCVKSLWLQVHTIQTANAIRTAGSVHSLLFVAEVCDQATFGQCDIVAGAQPTNYGEAHAQYKADGCPGIEGGVYFPAPYSVGDGNPDDAQVPYIAAHNRPDFLSRPARGFWNSQLNQVLVPTLGDINALVEVAWTENMFSVPSADPALCHDPAFDRVWAPSTDAGFKNQFVLWSFRLDLDGRPDGWSFTDRQGHAAPDCTEPGFACIPFYKGPGTTPGEDVYFNAPVRNAFDPFVVTDPGQLVDITEPGVFMPGYAGE